MRWLTLGLAMVFLGGVLKGVAVPSGSAATDPAAHFGALRWSFGRRAAVQVYFPDRSGQWLIPVARSVREATPAAALAELAAGPAPGGGLAPALPPDWRVAAVSLQGDTAHVALATGGTGAPAPGTAVEGAPAGVSDVAAALAATLRAAAPQVNHVALTVDGRTDGRFPAANPLNGGRAPDAGEEAVTLYYLLGGRPLPVPAGLPAGPDLPRRTLEHLLAAPAPGGVPWIPPGVSLEGFAVRRGVAHVRLRLSPDLASLVEAGVWNFAPYYMGVVYTLTQFPDIRKVQFEFAGLTALALRQCRTPLSVPLVRPGPETGRSKGEFRLVRGT